MLVLLAALAAALAQAPAPAPSPAPPAAAAAPPVPLIRLAPPASLRDVRLGPFTPFAVVGVHGAFNVPAETLSLYRYWEQPEGAPRRPGFAVRRQSKPRDGPPRVAWATSHACEGLELRLAALESLPLPRPEVPGLGREETPSIVVDGVIHTLWTRSPRWPEALGYSLTLDGNVNTPLAAWTEALRKTLEPCWGETAPRAG